MNIFRFSVAAFTLWALAACTQETTTLLPPVEEPVEQPAQQPVPIVLNSTVGSIETGTRAATGSTYTGSLYFLRTDQKSASDATYNSFKGTMLTGTRASNGVVTLSGQYYLARTTNGSTKLLGWYPQGTYSSSAGTITIPVDGKNDILYGLSGAGSKTSGIPNFSLAHQLTQIEVRVWGSADAYTAWGNITGITTTSTADNFVVTLNASTDAITSAKLSTTSKSGIALVGAADGAMGPVSFSGKTTSANAISCGFALIAPLAAAAKLPLAVTTVNGATQTVNVTVPTGGFVAGNRYIIYLQMTVTNITPSVTISNWVDSSTKTDANL